MRATSIFHEVEYRGARVHRAALQGELHHGRQLITGTLERAHRARDARLFIICDGSSQI